MTIVTCTPFRELDSVERRMRRLLDGVGFRPVLAPAADNYERETAKEGTTKKFTLHGRLGREFERRSVLPVGADTEHLKAVYASGVLELRAAKLKTEKPKKVVITST